MKILSRKDRLALPEKELDAYIERLEAHYNRGLSALHDRALGKYQPSQKILNFFPYYYRPNRPDEPLQRELADMFHIMVVVRTDRDIQKVKMNGFAEEMEQFVRTNLEDLGRGKAEDLNLKIDWESDENIQENYDGSYWDRLR